MTRRLVSFVRPPAVLPVCLLLLAAGCDLEPYCLNCPSAGGDGGLAGDGSVRDGQVVRPDGGGDAGVCVPLDEELCNEEDDDCDGTVDEGFDLTSDPRNCGACGVSCLLSNTEVGCGESECSVVGCLEGYADIDPSSPDCEYRCPVFPAQAELCNGVDDDCDGLVDEPADLPPPPEDLCRTTPGTLCEGVTPVCEARGGVTTWYCDYPEGVEHEPTVPNGIVLEERACDGVDGDCDGVADDAFDGLGNECDNGALGACRDVGIVACDPEDVSRTRCDLSVAPDPVPGAPFAELCNAVDDDCDGVVDNSDSDDPARIIDDMVRITHSGLDFHIYRYEATRPDADAGDAGTVSTRACSKAGALPWTNVGYEAARAACEDAGHRLCSAAEWQAACAGETGRVFPYGDTLASYEPLTCNGADRDGAPGGGVDHVLAPTGDLAACVSDDGLYDMSGNAKEWTADPRGNTGPPASTPIYVTRGGSAQSPVLGLTCQTELSRAQADTVLPFLGFRCCRDTAP